jgi:hypothetical protein
MVRSARTLNTWLDKAPLEFHSMERDSEMLRAIETRAKPGTCDVTFEASRDEARGELNRCLT